MLQKWPYTVSAFFTLNEWSPKILWISSVIHLAYPLFLSWINSISTFLFLKIFTNVFQLITVSIRSKSSHSVNLTLQSLKITSNIFFVLISPLVILFTQTLWVFQIYRTLLCLVSLSQTYTSFWKREMLELFKYVSNSLWLLIVLLDAIL